MRRCEKAHTCVLTGRFFPISWSLYQGSLATHLHGEVSFNLLKARCCNVSPHASTFSFANRDPAGDILVQQVSFVLQGANAYAGARGNARDMEYCRSILVHVLRSLPFPVGNDDQQNQLSDPSICESMNTHFQSEGAKPGATNAAFSVERAVSAMPSYH